MTAIKIKIGRKQYPSKVAVRKATGLTRGRLDKLIAKFGNKIPAKEVKQAVYKQEDNQTKFANLNEQKKIDETFYTAEIGLAQASKDELRSYLKKNGHSLKRKYDRNCLWHVGRKFTKFFAGKEVLERSSEVLLSGEDKDIFILLSPEEKKEMFTHWAHVYNGGYTKEQLPKFFKGYKLKDNDKQSLLVRGAVKKKLIKHNLRKELPFFDDYMFKQLFGTQRFYYTEA